MKGNEMKIYGMTFQNFMKLSEILKFHEMKLT